MATKIDDTIPTIKSKYGTVWDLNLTAEEVEAEAMAAMVHMWILHVPWAHPAWEYYVASLIHLRDVPGWRPAIKHSINATHEFTLLAVSPRHPPMQNAVPVALMPPNFVGQFEAASDAAAADYVRLRLHEICDGALSPDTDFRSDWQSRFPFFAVKPVTGAVH
jgi:hypothetical protein